jgi:dTDP-glucose 4,6-dehydratase
MGKARTLLVTGGAGFIGSHLCRALLARPAVRVVCLDKLGYAAQAEAARGLAAREPRFELLVLDLAHAEAVTAAVLTAAPDAILHLAAESHVDRSVDGPAAFVASNLLGSFHLLEAARRHWRGLDGAARARFRFLQVSTDEVYGPAAPGAVFTERSAYDPSSPYAATKAGADHLAMAYARSYGLPVILTRSSNNFGPGQFPEKLIPLVLARALCGLEIPIYGDGRQERDWLFVDDHVAGLLAVLARGRPGRSYNFAAGRTVANLDLVRRLLAALAEAAPPGAPYERLIRHVADRPGHDRRYALDPTLAAAELGWRPAVGLEEGLRRTVAWYLANRACWEPIAAEATRRQGLGEAQGGEPTGREGEARPHPVSKP